MKSTLKFKSKWMTLASVGIAKECLSISDMLFFKSLSLQFIAKIKANKGIALNFILKNLFISQKYLHQSLVIWTQVAQKNLHCLKGIQKYPIFSLPQIVLIEAKSSIIIYKMSGISNINKWVKTLAMVLMFSYNAVAQDEPVAADTTMVEDSVAQPTAPKYVRFKMNVDSVTQLVTYKAVVDQAETQADSFYLRAKRWANAKYKLSKNKKLILLDKPNEKLVLRARFPCTPAGGKYSKQSNGYIVFNLTLIFSPDGQKYKYIVNNIIFEPEVDPLDKEARNEPLDVTPFEYYIQVKHKKKQTDAMLQGADNDIKKLIEEIKKSLEDPKELDEDIF